MLTVPNNATYSTGHDAPEDWTAGLRTDADTQHCLVLLCAGCRPDAESMFSESSNHEHHFFSFVEWLGR